MPLGIGRVRHQNTLLDKRHADRHRPGRHENRRNRAQRRREHAAAPTDPGAARRLIETFLSGPGLARDYAEAGSSPISALEISTRSEAGEPQALACLDRYEDRLARALASVINLLDPDVIVLGGGLSNIERLYTSVPKRWGSFVFSDRVDTRLVRAAHGDSSGVRGAAWLWER
jgi:fructokinase